MQKELLTEMFLATTLRTTIAELILIEFGRVLAILTGFSPSELQADHFISYNYSL